MKQVPVAKMSDTVGYNAFSCLGVGNQRLTKNPIHPITSGPSKIMRFRKISHNNVISLCKCCN